MMKKDSSIISIQVLLLLSGISTLCLWSFSLVPPSHLSRKSPQPIVHHAKHQTSLPNSEERVVEGRKDGLEECSPSLFVSRSFCLAFCVFLCPPLSLSLSPHVACRLWVLLRAKKCLLVSAQDSLSYPVFPQLPLARALRVWTGWGRDGKGMKRRERERKERSIKVTEEGKNTTVWREKERSKGEKKMERRKGEN